VRGARGSGARIVPQRFSAVFAPHVLFLSGAPGAQSGARGAAFRFRLLTFERGARGSGAQRVALPMAAEQLRHDGEAQGAPSPARSASFPPGPSRYSGAAVPDAGRGRNRQRRPARLLLPRLPFQRVLLPVFPSSKAGFRAPRFLKIKVRF